MDIRFLGHSCFELKAGGDDGAHRPVPDRQPDGRRDAPTRSSPTCILLTHGHGDHFGDTVDIAKRTGATVVAIVEIAGEIGGEGVENVRDPNFGGTVTFDWGWVKLVPAWHTVDVAEGHAAHARRAARSTSAARLVYHLGDTACSAT